MEFCGVFKEEYQLPWIENYESLIISRELEFIRYYDRTSG